MELYNFLVKLLPPLPPQLFKAVKGLERSFVSMNFYKNNVSIAILFAYCKKGCWIVSYFFGDDGFLFCKSLTITSSVTSIDVVFLKSLAGLQF